MAWSAAARAAAAQARRNKGGKIHSLKRPGNFSFMGGTSKPIIRIGKNGPVQVGLRTAFSADSLRATLKRQVSKGAKSPYRAVTIVTAKGSFQASLGKKAFRGGSGGGLGLNRPSIGPGFTMTSRRTR